MWGTGNYHPITARIYTDLSFFTADPVIGRDVSAHLQLHHRLCGARGTGAHGGVARDPQEAAPAAHRGGDRPRQGGAPGAIWGKCNSLVDPVIIDALYDASAAGVQVDLIVRGICCLRPGIKGCRTTSGSSRSSGASWSTPASMPSATATGLPSPKAHVYISSADLMPRNLDRRVEALLPDPEPHGAPAGARPDHAANLLDNEQSWTVLPTAPAAGRARGRGGTVQRHKYFMTNPSLSGRGKSVKNSSPKSLAKRGHR
jgi:polyphosphate kinase